MTGDLGRFINNKNLSESLCLLNLFFSLSRCECSQNFQCTLSLMTIKLVETFHKSSALFLLLVSKDFNFWEMYEKTMFWYWDFFFRLHTNTEILRLDQNNIEGTVPLLICALRLDILTTDCLNEVFCQCCTGCF